MKTFQSYSGCSLKYLGLWTPNGLALLMLGPFEGIFRIYDSVQEASFYGILAFNCTVIKNNINIVDLKL